MIKKIRTQLNLSQAALAQILDVTQLTVLRWENGQCNISEGKLEKVKKLLALAKTISLVECNKKTAKIVIYISDHNPPHVHVNIGSNKSNWFRANIKDGLPLDACNASDAKVITKWILDNQNALMACWSRAYAGNEPSKIKEEL